MTTETTVPPTLTPELVDRLAALSGQSEGVAEVALSALAYGSLASLIAHEIIEEVDTAGDEGDEIVLTAHGRRIIDACAAKRRPARNARGQSGEMWFAPPIPDADRLTPDLVDRLAALAGQSDGIAELALSAAS